MVGEGIFQLVARAVQFIEHLQRNGACSASCFYHIGSKCDAGRFTQSRGRLVVECHIVHKHVYCHNIDPHNVVH